MGIQRALPQASGSGAIDWGVCDIFNTLTGSANVTSNVYSTILNVTGEGGLISAKAAGSTNGTQYSGLIRITIDGVVVFHGKSGNSASSFVGVEYDPNAIGLALPYIDTSTLVTNAYTKLFAPITFKQSLKIEITLVGLSSSQPYLYKYLLK
jgi:hypothetical protein